MKTYLKNMDWLGRSRVYVAKDNSMNGFYKIGCSKDPDKRCTTLGSGNCSVIYTSHPSSSNSTEVYAHNLLDNRRRVWRGSGKTEWFELSEFEVGIVKEMIENHSKFISLLVKYEELRRRFECAIEIIRLSENWIKPKFLNVLLEKVKLISKQ